MDRKSDANCFAIFCITEEDSASSHSELLFFDAFDIIFPKSKSLVEWVHISLVVGETYYSYARTVGSFSTAVLNSAQSERFPRSIMWPIASKVRLLCSKWRCCTRVLLSYLSRIIFRIVASRYATIILTRRQGELTSFMQSF